MPNRPEIPEPEYAAIAQAVATDIGARLVQARHDRGWMQEDVAAILGRSAQWVADIEKGRLVPRADILVALCAALETDVRWVLLGGVPEAASEFVSRVSSLEARLDERAQNTILALARYEASATRQLRVEGEKAKPQAFIFNDADESAAYSAGADPDAQAIADARAESARLSDAEDADSEQDDEEQRRRRRRG